jgi:hypothetical protein
MGLLLLATSLPAVSPVTITGYHPTMVSIRQSFIFCTPCHLLLPGSENYRARQYSLPSPAMHGLHRRSVKACVCSTESVAGHCHPHDAAIDH